MTVTVWLDERDDPVVDHTKTLTEYVPDGRLVTTKAVELCPAASVTVDVATWSV